MAHTNDHDEDEYDDLPPAVAGGTRLADTIDLVKEFGDVELLDVNGHGFASVPANRSLLSLEQFRAEAAHHPMRHRGTTQLSELLSFCQFVNRFTETPRTPNTSAKIDSGDHERRTVIFATTNVPKDLKQSTIRFTAVLNAPTHELPGFQDFRADYPVQFDEAWLEWLKVDGLELTQGQFASFIEDRIGDIVDPVSDEKSTIFKVAEYLRGSGDAVLIGSRAQMMDTSRGVSIRSAQNVANTVRLADGSVLMSYAAHNDTAEGSLKIPTLFAIRIPVAVNGTEYELAARLRYNVNSGVVKWTIKLWRPDLTLRQAANDMAQQIFDETQLPVVAGVAPPELSYSSNKLG